MEYGEIIQRFFIEVVFPILGAVVLSLIGLVIKKISAKLGNEEILKHQTQIEELAISAIGYAEEKALERMKKGPQDKITGEQKLDMAIGWLMSKAKAVDRDQAREWIEGTIPKLAGMGATGEKTIKKIEEDCDV